MKNINELKTEAMKRGIAQSPDGEVGLTALMDRVEHIYKDLLTANNIYCPTDASCEGDDINGHAVSYSISLNVEGSFNNDEIVNIIKLFNHNLGGFKTIYISSRSFVDAEKIEDDRRQILDEMNIDDNSSLFAAVPYVYKDHFDTPQVALFVVERSAETLSDDLLKGRHIDNVAIFEAFNNDPVVADGDYILTITKND